MIKTKKMKIISILLIVTLIILGSTGAYLVKVSKEKNLNVQIEEVNKVFSSLKISNMNSDEEELYMKLKESFNKSISDKNLIEANETLKTMSDLKSSVEKRVKEEEEKNAEEERIREENERELASKDETEKKEEEVKEDAKKEDIVNKSNTSNISNGTNVQQPVSTNNEPKIANTSVA